MIGQLLNRRYRIVRVLGAGGFGQTYVAEDTHFPGNPTCVVKHLKPASNSPNVLQLARDWFAREAKTLAELGSHQQIPRLLAYFEENQEFYLVQEFIDGHTLSTELPPGQTWTENQVIQLLQEILRILEFVHAHNVIHRDIKPDNIIRRTSDNSLFLIDFGAIKEVQNQQISAAAQGSAGATGTRIGTPGYMPTEQARGKPRPNSDIYALGMVGIQALTGTYPHLLEEDNEGEIIWRHRAQVSPQLQAVLTKMVGYHFKDRYKTATENLQAVQQLANSSYPQTSQVTNVTNAVHELTLEWMEAGLLKTQTIREGQNSKNPGTVRIGRDPGACDIVSSEPTVSGLHVEIFFNSQQQCFYVRNLRQSNPPIVDGKSLVLTGDAPLSQGSILRLGQLELRVKAIALQQSTTGYTPLTNYVIEPVNNPPVQIPPTRPPQGATPLPKGSQSPPQNTLESGSGASHQKTSARSYAGSDRRLGAWMIDSFILTVGTQLINAIIISSDPYGISFPHTFISSVVLAGLYTIVGTGAGGLAGAFIYFLLLGLQFDRVFEGSFRLYTVMGISCIIFQWLYFTICESSNQQGTIGKKIVGILVTDVNGNRISFNQANVRHWSKNVFGIIILGLLMLLWPIILGVLLIIAAFTLTKKKQALHDIIAGKQPLHDIIAKTMVVKR